MTAYYNEIDPFAASWLRELIKGKHIAPGEVDERSITEVQPEDLQGFTQVHLFAGIGVWSYALRQAGWDDDRPVWTGSCPCQPFSGAGKGKGIDDARHLWPEMHRLVAECRPPVCFGEQVAQKAGTAWFDIVQADMESQDYACGMVVFPACGVGAPHLRQRLYWVADADFDGRGAGWHHNPSDDRGKPGSTGQFLRVADAGSVEWRLPDESGREDTEAAGCCEAGGLDNSASTRRKRSEQEPESETRDKARVCVPCASVRAGGIPDADCARLQGQRSDSNSEGRQESYLRSAGLPDGTGNAPAATNGFWRAADWLACRDAKWRPARPGTCPLVDGATNRVGRLRGYGNAIVAPQAIEVVKSYMEVIDKKPDKIP